MIKTKEEFIKKWNLNDNEDDEINMLKDLNSIEQTNSIEDLITRNYNAQIRRGQINDDSNCWTFTFKIEEELEELNNSIHSGGQLDPNELADIILVCFSMAKYFNIDIMQVLSEKVEYNEKRTD